MSRKKVKVINLDLDADVIDNVKSLAKMFMMSFDDVVNLLLRMELIKEGHEF